MINAEVSNFIGESYCRYWEQSGERTGFLDANNIGWKIVNGKWIGKRSVWTYDLRACWLEDTTIGNIKSWWCGINADYSEIFKRN